MGEMLPFRKYEKDEHEQPLDMSAILEKLVHVCDEIGIDFDYTTIEQIIGTDE